MIFFDLDGVLLDSNGVWLQVDDTFLGRRGLKPTEEYFLTVGHSIFPVAARFTREYYHLPDTAEEIMDEWRSLACDAYAHHLPLKPGAQEVLNKYKSEGEKLVLLTASLPELCRAALARHGLDSCFDGLFFAQDHGMEKRDPRIYTLAARTYQVSPQACTLMEDAPQNCAAARKAGFTVIGVYDRYYDARWDEVRAACHRTVRSLEELL